MVRKEHGASNKEPQEKDMPPIHLHTHTDICKPTGLNALLYPTLKSVSFHTAAAN